MDFNINVYLKNCEYQFYTSRSLIMLIYVNAEIHLSRSRPLMHHAIQFVTL